MIVILYIVVLVLLIIFISRIIALNSFNKTKGDYLLLPEVFNMLKADQLTIIYLTGLFTILGILGIILCHTVFTI